MCYCNCPAEEYDGTCRPKFNTPYYCESEEYMEEYHAYHEDRWKEEYYEKKAQEKSDMC